MADDQFLAPRVSSWILTLSGEMAVGEVYGASRYIKGVSLGEGTYGVVFKAIDKVVRCLLPVCYSKCIV